MKRKINISTHLMLWLFGFSLIAICAPSSNAQSRSRDRASREVYTGNIFYIGGLRGSTVTTFTLTIDSYTPEPEVAELVGGLQRGGQDALLKAISKERRGRIQIGTQLARDVNAIWVSNDEEEGGRKITALFERWQGFAELRRGSRSVDYPFTYLELFIEDNGKGEGTMIPAAKVRFKRGNTIEVENFGIYPARLTNVRRRR